MMACGGVPIVAKVTGYDEYIIDGHNALVTESDNIPKTKKLLQKLIDDQKLYNLLKSNSQKTVKKMSWNKSILKLTSIIRK